MKTQPRLLVLALLTGHLAGVVGLVGVDAVISNRPVVQSDLGLHYYRAAVMRQSGELVGPVWDPGYRAGHLVGAADDISNRLGELLVGVLAFLPQKAAWNTALIVIYGCVPLLVWLGARWTGARRESQAVSLALAILLFWNTKWGPQAFLQWGMYGWVFFSATLPLQLGALQRVLTRPDTRSVLALTGATTVAAYSHAFAPAYLPLLILVVLARAREIRWRHVGALGCCAALTGILVWPIARAILATLGEVESTAGLALYFQAEVWEVVALVGSPSRALPNALLLLCAVGIATRQLDRPRLELALIALIIVLVSLFVFMPFPPTRLEPTRHVLPALFLASLPASGVLLAACKQLRSRSRLVLWATAGLALALVWPTAFGLSLTALGKGSLASTPGTEAEGLTEYLRQNTSPLARVLFEDDGGRPGGDHYGSTPLVSYLATEIDRQLIGGADPVISVRGDSVTFTKGRILGKPVAELLDPELKGFLKSYNIGTVVVWSGTSRDRFSRLGLTAHHLAGGFDVFHTGLAQGFAAGADSVTATAVPNEIRVTGATSSPTLLRWQWHPRMRTEPPLPIRAAKSPYAPFGFILVENGGEREFVVRFRS